MSSIQVNLDENLARYIFSRSQYSPAKQTVKYSAFIPPRDMRLSVFLISNLQVNEIWEIGATVANSRSKILLARADIKAESVIEAKLYIDADNNPSHHANIFGWPEEKSAIRLKALELADKALLHLKL